MSIYYSITRIKNSFNKDKAGLFYAKAQVREVIDLDRLAKEIGQRSCIPDGEVICVVRMLARLMAEHLRDGDLVDMEDIGRFYFELSSQGVEKAEDFKRKHIRKARLHFSPGKFLKKELSDLEFSKTEGLKYKNRAEERKKYDPVLPSEQPESW